MLRCKDFHSFTIFDTPCQINDCLKNVSTITMLKLLLMGKHFTTVISQMNLVSRKLLKNKNYK